jgi:predicted amidohydrolase
VPVLVLAALAGHFGRDLDANFARIGAAVAEATEAGADLLVLPDAALGGYLPRFGASSDDADGPDDLPPALDPDGAEIARLVELAGPMTLCAGYCEQAGGRRYNAAVCVSGDGVLGRHRKVHQPAGERGAYSAGDRFDAFDTPVGRLGMMIDYDKTFPEAARRLAADGATVLACLSAWPASLTNRAPRLAVDRQTRLFDLYDCARAAENQVVVVSANQTGRFGHLTFVGRAKVVGPGGEILVRSTAKAALVTARVDVEAEVAQARHVLDHLAERRPEAYGPPILPAPVRPAPVLPATVSPATV